MPEPTGTDLEQEQRRRRRRARKREDDAPELDARPKEPEAEAEAQPEEQAVAAQLAAAGHSAEEISQILEHAHGAQKSVILATLQQAYGNAFVGQLLHQKENAGPAIDPAALSLGLEFFLGGQWETQSRRQEPLHLTPEIIARVAEWLPGLPDPALRKLWDPEPKTPREAVLRLQNSRALPAVPDESNADRLKRVLAAPPSLPGGSGEGGGAVLSFLGAGMPGLHIAPTAPPPAPEIAGIIAGFQGRGIRLALPQVQALLASKEQGIAQIEAGLHTILPGELRSHGHEVAEWLVNLLLTASLQAQLHAEAPGGSESLAIQDEPPPPAENGVELTGTLVELVRQIPTGMSVIVHF